MTSDEHTLIMLMFTRQAMMIRSLIEILKRENVIKDDDYEVFEALIRDAERVHGTNVAVTRAQYLEFGKMLNVSGLPDN